MPYKIVHTIENGKLTLASVPDSWEKDGVLYWPPKHKHDMFGNGKKPEHDWVKLTCVVKKRNILTFEDAGEELKKMCAHSELESKLDDLSEKLLNVVKDQKALWSIQRETLSKLTELKSTVENFIKGCASQNIKIDKNMNFKPIAKLEDLVLLEKNLQDPTYKAELEQKFSVICSKQDGKGINAAYKLIDLIFTREFMNQCSWAGGSRTEDKKICFKVHHRTIELFFHLVKATDRFFTLDDCENFLKTILKNSRKRSEITIMRRSSCMRKRRKGYKNRKQTVTIETENDDRINTEDDAGNENVEERINEEDSLC